MDHQVLFITEKGVKVVGTSLPPKLRTVVERNDDYIVIHTRAHSYASGGRSYHEPARYTVWKIISKQFTTRGEEIKVSGLSGQIQFNVRRMKEINNGK